MFKTVATKIAHNSTIPALAGKGDLRPLQDLITAEKTVLSTYVSAKYTSVSRGGVVDTSSTLTILQRPVPIHRLQQLSVDFAKASEALRTWGLGEGDDLGVRHSRHLLFLVTVAKHLFSLQDILSASTTILTHFSSALSQYAAHGHKIRDQLKAVRTREEALGELKRRRRNVASSADSADKRLSKMSPEHKNLVQQQETLARLRNEIRALDTEIMAEEAALSDFKRSQTRLWMGLKFGGLLECSEKGTIAGEFGKLVISEIPEEVTPPGMPRSMYYGHQRTEQLVAEAHRCVNEIALTTVPPARVIRRDPQSIYQSGYDPQVGGWSYDDTAGPNGTPQYLPSPHGLGTGHFLDPNSPSLGMTAPPPQPRTPQSPSSHYEASHGVDEFGSTSSDRTGSRFNTFPTRTAAAPSEDAGNNYMRSSQPPSLSARRDVDQSFSNSIAEALNSVGSRNEELDSFSRITRPQSEELPGYTPSGGITPSTATAAPQIQLESSYHTPEDRLRSSAFVEDGHGEQAAYMSGVEDTEPDYSDVSYQGRQSLDGTPVATVPSMRLDEGHVNDTITERERGAHAATTESAQIEGHALPEALTEANRDHNSDGGSVDFRPQHQRMLSSTMSPEEEERALNVAAAREITREMETLRFSHPKRDSLPQSVHSTVTDLAEISSGNNPGNRHSSAAVSGASDDGPAGIRREPSPLLPPSAPFSRRAISPRPSTERFGQSSPISGTHPLQTLHPYQLPPSYDQASSEHLPRMATASAPEQQQQQRVTPTQTYRTPPEYTRSSSVSPISVSVSRSTGSSINSNNASPVPSGTRTISAAAFKRAAPRKGSSATASVSEMERRNLPGSLSFSHSFSQSQSQSQPQSPVQQPQSPLIPGLGPPGAAAASRGRANSDSRPLPMPPSAQQDEDEFDAYYRYTDDYDNGPPHSHVRQPGYGNGNAAEVGRGGGERTTDYYREGRFVTNLEAELR
ncbi:hypothetical protein AMATHDRAFT_63163 [Amanita thiersii Skay4041]|uniref:Uncharacterized protein n=1 Tax=Amanita thiersii Skay4041 TaxID=703135 RepID=A0A2A9NMB5_9AGAR|nr:hypothetical protein AMATHDRAFT_63163 [Amanita thiersii Skay4041]